MTSTEGGSIKSPNFPSNYPDNKVQVTELYCMSNEHIAAACCHILNTMFFYCLKVTILYIAPYSNTPRSGTCPWLPAPRFSSPSRASPWRPTAGELLSCDWLAWILTSDWSTVAPTITWRWRARSTAGTPGPAPSPARTTP